MKIQENEVTQRLHMEVKKLSIKLNEFHIPLSSSTVVIPNWYSPTNWRLYYKCTKMHFLKKVCFKWKITAWHVGSIGENADGKVYIISNKIILK